MVDFINLFQDFIDVDLVKIYFESFDNSEFANLKYYDDFDIESIDKNSMKLRFERKLFFVPNGTFKLSISFLTVLTFKKEYLDAVEIEKYNIPAEVSKKAEDIFVKATSKASLLIGTLTDQFMGTPIVLPPIYKPKVESYESSIQT